MNTISLQRKIVLLAFFFFSLCTYAVNIVNAPAAGQLSTILTQEQRDTITQLKLTGILDSREPWSTNADFYVLKSMPKLQYLDLSDVDVNNDKIPREAFYSNKNIKEVLLPNTLKTIDYNAFYECSSLEKVKFPEGLEVINQNVFYNCTSLSDLNLPEGLQTIGSSSFQYCTSLVGNVVFPSTITSIGDNVFYGCNNMNTCKIKAITPPAVALNSFNHIIVIYVPKGSGDDYRNAANWQNRIIVDGDTPLTVSLNVTTAGTLGEEALKQVSHMSQIQKLVVSGPLNNADWLQIKTMTSLIEADLSAAESVSIPNEIFYNRVSLLSIKLPLNLEKIGGSTFANCYGLKNVELPESLLSIDNSAFYDCNAIEYINLPSKLNFIGEHAFYSCDNLKEISIPSGVTVLYNYVFQGCAKLEKVTFGENTTQIGYRTFRDCTSLKNAKLPATIKNIGEQAFYNCTSLSFVELPNSIEAINTYAFYNCTSLKEVELPKFLTVLGSYSFQHCPVETIILPSTLMSIGYRVFETSLLTKITSLQPTPPILTNDPFLNINKSTCELVVPYWAETSYKLADYWNLFLNVSTTNTEIDYLPIKGSLVLTDNVRPMGKPSVEVFTNANLSVRGNAPFGTNEFILRQNLNNYYVSSYQYSNLISESSNISAENVKMDMTMYGGRWVYLTFPFDVAVSDITIDENAFFVFRKYDGNNRAINGAGNNWVNMGSDETLRAGTGYIFQCNANVNNLVIKATESTKNNLFMSDSWSTSLNTYATGNPADESWNLVGNPFPSYFDIYYMDYTAPMTIWSGSGYSAISPLDDNYVLRPMEAFFVQKPTDLNAVVFNTEGRQTTTQMRERSSLKRNANALRKLINLSLSNQDAADKSRIVINPDAELTYEMTRDAAKFMSSEMSIPQLYSIDTDGVSYAINERPAANGVIELGYYAGVAGEHTIALDAEVNGVEIILKDKLLDRSVDLTVSSYTFNTETGTNNSRFELKVRVGNSETGIGGDEVSTIKVYAEKEAIVIENASEKDVVIYTLNGDKIITAKLTDNKNTMSVAQGIYIVKIGEKAFKVAVF